MGCLKNEARKLLGKMKLTYHSLGCWGWVGPLCKIDILHIDIAQSRKRKIISDRNVLQKKQNKE